LAQSNKKSQCTAASIEQTKTSSVVGFVYVYVQRSGRVYCLRFLNVYIRSF